MQRSSPRFSHLSCTRSFKSLDHGAGQAPGKAGPIDSMRASECAMSCYASEAVKIEQTKCFQYMQERHVCKRKTRCRQIRQSNRGRVVNLLVRCPLQSSMLAKKRTRPIFTLKLNAFNDGYAKFSCMSGDATGVCVCVCGVCGWERYHPHHKITGRKTIFGNSLKSCNALHDRKIIPRFLYFM